MAHDRDQEIPPEELESRVRTTEGEERVIRMTRHAASIRKADPARAEEVSREALALARELGSESCEAAALLSLAMCKLECGDCEAALPHQLTALQIADDLGDSLMQARVHADLGLTHHVWRNFDRALDHHRTALRLFEEFADLGGQAQAHNGIGLIHAMRNDCGTALGHFQEALELARQSGDRIALLGALNNVGNVFSNEGRYEEAIEYFRESIDLKEELGDRKGLAGSMINLGRAQGELGDHEDARNTLEAGLALAEETGATEFAISGLDCLSILRQRMGDLEGAMDACRRLVRITRESHDEEQSRRIAEMQARFDTERAAREAELNRIKTQELSKQLEQAQRLGVVGRLAGGIAHDFNNLLTAIGGYSDLMLLNLGEHHPLRPNVDEIRRAADRARSLTRQLLAFSRKQILQPQVLDLSRVLLELRRMLDRLLGEDVDLRIRLEPDLHPVFADAGQIEQVVVNLVVNSRDAMPGGGALTLETRNVESGSLPEDVRGGLPPGDYVCLSVRDEGCGMSADILDHIFEPFFTTKSHDKGTGLGLATVHGIVTQSGGAVSVESEPGRGALFSVFLPRTTRRPEELEPDRDARPPVLGEETILVVEDDPAVRNLATEILRMHGHLVLIAPDSDEAMNHARSHDGPIHLLLTDVVLPGMRGTELARRIRATRPEMRVLFMSGHSFDELSPDGALTPDTQLIEKPFGADRLAQRVREVLDRRRETPRR